MSTDKPCACGAVTRTGKRCRAWAQRGTDPPRCAVHAWPEAGGAERGGHWPTGPADLIAGQPDGLPAGAGAELLDREIAGARDTLARLLRALREVDPEEGAEPVVRLAEVAFEGARTVARLLRDRRALGGEAAGGILAALSELADEVMTELGTE